MFWYQLSQVHLENWLLKWTERDMQTEIHLSPESSWTHDWKKDVLFGFGNCMSHGHRRQ